MSLEVLGTLLRVLVSPLKKRVFDPVKTLEPHVMVWLEVGSAQYNTERVACLSCLENISALADSQNFSLNLRLI